MPGERSAYVLGASLEGHPAVTRTIALGGHQTLEALHTLLRAGFG